MNLNRPHAENNKASNENLDLAFTNLRKHAGRIDKDLYAGCRVLFRQVKFLEELNFSKAA
jgi:hypothetical protein